MNFKPLSSFSFGSNTRVFVCLILFTCVLAASDVKAHDPGLSAAELRIGNDSLMGELSFALADIEPLCPIDIDRDQQISSEEFEAARPKLEQMARRSLAISLDGESAVCEEATVRLDTEGSALRFHLTFFPVSGSHLELESVLIQSLARGHRQFLVVKDRRGNTFAEQMLQSGSAKFVVNLQGQSDGVIDAVHRFVVLGVEHILTGYDHLAFLLAFLLAGSALREVLKIITSFTLAHSISLALATFNILTISPSVVEPLIAVSVVYIGFENLLRRNLNRRWLLTFGFGLIHGLGFAAVLRELNIGTEARTAIVPLLSFNLGVEFGQVAIAAFILPLIWKLKSRPWFVPKLVPVCSTCVAILGAFWLIERLLPSVL
jgi:hydrogenase/urease accessory protein HupE